LSQKAPPPTGRSVTTTCLTACARTHACTHADDGNLHLQLNLPRCHPYVHPEIVANPIIEQVAGAVLHGLVYIRYVNGNTACPGATVQGLHVDTQGDWGMKLAVNFSVDDITPENGATEVWPKTHRGTLLPEESLQEQGKHKELVERMRNTPGCGPTQLAVPKGAVCLRDLRVWHRAMPNPSDFPRHMYYLSYSADGDHVHTSVEPEPGAPTAPLSPEPDGARAEVLPTRDPLANSSQLGALRCLNSHTEQQHTPVLWFEEHVFQKNSPR
jgi:ectoine hydroxylase-related dioxygenase (phytanoyl-CoA dioxygenase family)